jgi:hypothetical protein
MHPTVRKALMLGAVGALVATGCVDAPAPTAAATQPSPELAARLAAEQRRIDSLARLAGPRVVVSDGLLSGLLGTTTSLLTGVVNGLTYTLLRCDVLPYAGTTKVIGPLGGSISVGRSTLVIPAGALAASTVITAEQPSTSSAEVRFKPHGLAFAKPATLTMSYASCLQPSGYVRSIVYMNDEGKIVEAPPTVDNVVSDKVTGPIGHFSGYLIAHTRIIE